MTPRSFWELLADSLLLLKVSFMEWLAIVSAGLLPGLAATALAASALGLTDIPSLKDAIATGTPAVVLPLLLAGLLDKTCGLLAFLALMRAAAARDEGRRLGARRAFAEASPLLWTFISAQLRALAGIVLGLIKLLWPGLKLCVFYAFVPAAVTAEAAPAKEALARSERAARVDPFKTAVNLAAAMGVGMAAFAGLDVALNAAMSLPATAVPGGESLLEALLLGFVNQLVGGLVLGWLGAFSILLYRDFTQALSPRPA